MPRQFTGAVRTYSGTHNGTAQHLAPVPIEFDLTEGAHEVQPDVGAVAPPAAQADVVLTADLRLVSVCPANSLIDLPDDRTVRVIKVVPDPDAGSITLHAIG